MTIKVGILGYGNLGKGVECAIAKSTDMELAGIFTRRNPENVKPYDAKTPVYTLEDAINMKDCIDVMILCGGSANDLPTQSVEYAKYFNIVDSFDTHARIPEHFKAVNEASIN